MLNQSINQSVFMIHLTFAAQNIGLRHYLNKLIQVVCIAVQGILSHGPNMPNQ